VSLFPDACACGHRKFAEVTPYYTHQVIELPVIRPEATHWMLHITGSACRAARCAKPRCPRSTPADMTPG
jgi:hypothetical protein